MLKLMYITNRPEVAQIAEVSGVDRIFVDMEYIGKADRQGGMDTVQSHHTVEDVKKIRACVSDAEIMVRCNPIHKASKEYGSSEEEINAVIEAGADIVMLPYFKTVEEVKTFIGYVKGRVRTILLLETPEAVSCVDEILEIEGVDELFIGLNDLSLGYGKKFMFTLLADGTVEMLCEKFRKKHIPYGFGGIASLGKGLLPSEHIIMEHYRLGSTCAILSRSFCNVNIVNRVDTIRTIFEKGLGDIRKFEEKCARGEVDFQENIRQVREKVSEIIGEPL